MKEMHLIPRTRKLKIKEKKCNNMKQILKLKKNIPVFFKKNGQSICFPYRHPVSLVEHPKIGCEQRL